ASIPATTCSSAASTPRSTTRTPPPRQPNRAGTGGHTRGQLLPEASLAMPLGGRGGFAGAAVLTRPIRPAASRKAFGRRRKAPPAALARFLTRKLRRRLCDKPGTV